MGWEAPPAQVARNTFGQLRPAISGRSEGLHSAEGRKRTCPSLRRKRLWRNKVLNVWIPKFSPGLLTGISYVPSSHNPSRSRVPHAEDVLQAWLTLKRTGKVLGHGLVTRDGTGSGDGHCRNAITIAISIHDSDQASFQYHLHGQSYITPSVGCARGPSQSLLTSRTCTSPRCRQTLHVRHRAPTRASNARKTRRSRGLERDPYRCEPRRRLQAPTGIFMHASERATTDVLPHHAHARHCAAPQCRSSRSTAIPTCVPDHPKAELREETGQKGTTVPARLAPASDNVVHVVIGRRLLKLEEPCVNSKSPSTPAIMSRCPAFHHCPDETRQAKASSRTVCRAALAGSIDGRL